MLLNGPLKKWILWFLLLVLAAFIVPFTLLSQVEKFYGAFLFWTVFAVVAIVSVSLITKNWRD